MTDFIPFGTPPGSTGNPKSIIADEFQVGQKIKVDTTAEVQNSQGGTVTQDLTNTAYLVSYSIDRRPMLQSGYATQSMSTTPADQTGTLNSNTMGQPTQNYRKTPATGADMTNPSTNGRLLWVQDKLLTDVCPQFERFVIFNPAGFSNVNATSRYYPSNPITGMDLSSIDLYWNETTKYNISPVASPFTDTGLDTGVFGNSREAWTAAISALKSSAQAQGGTNLEVNCYAGFHPVYTDNTLATPLKDSLGYDPAWTRAPKPDSWDDSYWKEEMEGALALGFTGFSFDAGTWVDYIEDSNGSFRGPASSYFSKTFYEAIPFYGGGAPGGDWTYEGNSTLPVNERREWRASDGDTYPITDKVYAGTAYFGLHGVIFGDATHETGVGPYIENVTFDPATTEVHCIFDWNRLASVSRLNLTEMQIKQLMWTAHQNGLIVGVTGGEFPAATNDGWTCGDFRQYALDLYAGTAVDPTQDIPLPSGVTTYGMTSGSYSSYSDPEYSPMAWVTVNTAFFSNAGLASPTSGNEISDQASADAYEDFVVNVALESLAAKEAAGQFSNGMPICLDPEDLGVDAALKFADMTRSAREAAAANGNSDWSDSTFWNSSTYPISEFSYTPASGFTTDATVAGPLIINMIKNIKKRIHQAYPLSPVGMYQVGPTAFWLTGWSGVNSLNVVGSGKTTASGIIWDWNLQQQIAENPNYYGWQCLKELDFVFLAYYPAQNDTGKLPFPYFTNIERMHNLFYSVLKYYGPSTAQWANYGSKFIIGVSVGADVFGGATSDLSNVPLRWVSYADNANLAGPTYWENATTTYPDLTGTMTTLNGLSNPDFVQSTQAVQQDLLKWMWDDTPQTGWQTPTNVKGYYESNAASSSEALPDSFRDFKVGIWDGSYTGVISDGTNTFNDRYTTAAAGGASASSWMRGSYYSDSVYNQWVADGSIDTASGVIDALPGYLDANVTSWIIPTYLQRGDNHSYTA